MGRRVNTDQVSFLLTSISCSVSGLIVCVTKGNVGIFMLKKITVVKIRAKLAPMSSSEENDIILLVTASKHCHLWLKDFGLAVGTFRLSH